MLTFRAANKYLLIFAVAAFLLMIIDPQYGWLLLILLIMYFYILVRGAINVCSGFYVEVFCKGTTQEKIVALTFDDGPDSIHTTQILDILNKHDVKASFFIIGKKAEQNEALIRRILEERHTIGNHSYSHDFFFDLFGRKKMEQDLLKTDEFIEKISGAKPAYFRPPYGVTNPTVAKVVKKLGHKAIGWSVRSLDTVLKDEDKIVGRVLDRLHPGAVILLHDDREITVKSLEKLILKIKNEGYRFIGLEDLKMLE